MKIHKINNPFPIISIDDFIPSVALVRAAAASFDQVNKDDWVKYGADSGQVQFCSKGRALTPTAALAVLDYIAENFDPSTVFEGSSVKSFPDMSYHGGGMMIAPNSCDQGGFLGMHVDADVHKINPRWKRRFSTILCASEDYDSSFDLHVHGGIDKGATIPYKFNRLNIFECSENSWHGFPKITSGLDRKTLGVMYWSLMSDEEMASARTKAKFFQGFSSK